METDKPILRADKDANSSGEPCSEALFALSWKYEEAFKIYGCRTWFDVFCAAKSASI
jgi:hypothetical protein